MPVKNIIFDLGGVILNIDFQLTFTAFEQLGAEKVNWKRVKKTEQEFFHAYETGKITSQAFRKKMCALLGLTVSDQIFDQAWNALLLGLPAEHLALLRQLKQQYRTFLFSNTNAIHSQEFFKITERQHQIKSLDEFFEKQYYSHLLGLRKPDPEGFLTILNENNLAPAETVFVDDLYANIQGAQAVGLHTIHINKSHNLSHVPALIQQLNK